MAVPRMFEFIIIVSVVVTRHRPVYCIYNDLPKPRLCGCTEVENVCEDGVCETYQQCYSFLEDGCSDKQQRSMGCMGDMISSARALRCPTKIGDTVMVGGDVMQCCNATNFCNLSLDPSPVCEASSISGEESKDFLGLPLSPLRTDSPKQTTTSGMQSLFNFGSMFGGGLPPPPPPPQPPVTEKTESQVDSALDLFGGLPGPFAGLPGDTQSGGGMDFFPGMSSNDGPPAIVGAEEEVQEAEAEYDVEKEATKPTDAASDFLGGGGGGDSILDWFNEDILMGGVITVKPREEVQCSCTPGQCDGPHCTTTDNCFVLVRNDCAARPERIMGCINSVGVRSGPWMCPPVSAEIMMMTVSLFQCCREPHFCNNQLQPTRPKGCATEPLVKRPEIVAVSKTSPLVTALQVSIPLLIIIVVVATVIFIMRRMHKQQLKALAEAALDADTAAAALEVGDLAVPVGESTLYELCGEEYSSGSGGGMAKLVQRTMSKDIKLLCCIGKGKYCEVWHGKWKWGKVAVKIFPSREELQWRREIEIYNTAFLQHENVLAYMGSDLASEGGCTQYWLVMQLHEAGSLYDHLQQVDSVDAERLFCIVGTSLAGLLHLHTRFCGIQGKLAIAHRDLKSRNILVKASGDCCIADFGLSLVQKADGTLDVGDNLIVGTKRYMAPEILSESIGRDSFEAFTKTDVYAMALVIWEVACRVTTPSVSGQDYHYPYHDMVPGDPSIELMRELVVDRAQRPPIPASWHTDQVLAPIGGLISECWAHNAMARHTTFKMMKTLRKVEQAWMTPAAAGPPPIAMATTTRGDARIPTVATAMTTSVDSQILATATTTAKCGGMPASIAATRESIAAWLPADSPLPSDKTKTPPSPPSGDIPVPAPPSTQLLAPSSGVQVPVTYTDTRVLLSGGEVKPLTPAQLAKIAMMKSSDEDLPVTSRGRCDDPLAITFVPRLASQEREFGVTCDEVAFKVTQRDTNVTSTSTSGVMQHGVATSTSGFAADAGEASEGRETSAAVRKLAELTATPEDEEDAALRRQQQSSDTSVNVC